MQVNVYAVIGRRPRFTGALASVHDFIYVDARGETSGAAESCLAAAVPVATLTPAEFLAHPNFSLYCFDEASSQAIFVELPSALALSSAPFVHQAQYEQATRVACVPLALFVTLAAQLPPIEQPILLYMSARSGSTLLSHAFNASGAIVSLSEPDVATQFVHLRQQAATATALNGMAPRELPLLAASSARFLFRPYAQQEKYAGADYCIKFRSEGVQVMDFFQSVFPAAKNIFLYRDALGWVNSFQRIFTKLNLVEPLTIGAWQEMYEGFLRTDLTHLRAYLAPQQTHVTLPEQLTLWWIAIMEWYLAQWEQGVPVLAVRYLDLNQRRESTLSAILSYCNLAPEQLPAALNAFESDSQAGTPLARDVPHRGATRLLGDQAVEAIVTILQRHPQLRHPNFWAPGTLDVDLYLNTRQHARAQFVRPTTAGR